MTRQRVTDTEFAAALVAGRTQRETEIRAQSVRYVADRDAIELLTARQAGLLIPRGWIGALQDVPIEELGQMEVWPDGSAIALASRDIHISVDGLITALLPAILPPKAVAALFASRSGRATSEAKRSSAQENGWRGGRSRKGARSVPEAGAP